MTTPTPLRTNDLTEIADLMNTHPALKAVVIGHSRAGAAELYEEIAQAITNHINTDVAQLTKINGGESLRLTNEATLIFASAAELRQGRAFDLVIIRDNAPKLLDLIEEASPTLATTGGQILLVEPADAETETKVPALAVAESIVVRNDAVYFNGEPLPYYLVDSGIEVHLDKHGFSTITLTFPANHVDVDFDSPFAPAPQQ